MHHRALKLSDPRHIRPARLVQNPRRTDQNITDVPNDTPARKILNIDAPTPFAIIPLRLPHLMACSNELLKPVLFRKGLKVLPHLLPRCVDAARARVRLEAVGVVVRGEVACYSLYHRKSDIRSISQFNRSERHEHSPLPRRSVNDVLLVCSIFHLFFFFFLRSFYNLPRIPILKPHARDPFVLLINHQFEIFKRALQLVCETETREAGADADDSYPSRVVDGIRGAVIVFSRSTVNVLGSAWWTVITWWRRHGWN